MATTFVDFTGDGTKQSFDFSFPSLQESDIKVTVDSQPRESGTHYNITGYTTTGGGSVVFIDNSSTGGTNHIPSDPQAVRIFRQTSVEKPSATYTAGASVKAADLNVNHNQLLFNVQELVDDIKGNYIISAFNESVDGSRTDFTIDNPPLSAQQVILSINGVVQKPNSGTSTPSEGFALDGNTIKLAAAPSSGSDIFVIILGARHPVDLQPLDGSVTDAKVASNAAIAQSKLNLSITNSEIASNAAIDKSKLNLSITNSDIVSNAAINSTKLSFGTGANARTVDSKLGDILHFKDFGAVGDGSTNDATALLAAFNAATGKTLDGGGLTYKCNSMLSPTSQNIIVQNATFDFSGVDATGFVGASNSNAYIMFAGSVGTELDVDSTISDGSDSVGITGGTTALSTPNSWHFLKSSTQVATEGTETVTLGQYIFIKEYDASTDVATLHNNVLYKFLDDSNPKVVPVTMKKNITFKNVTIKGANPAGTTTARSHTGLRFKHCEGVTVDNCTFEDIDYAGGAIETSVNVNISNCTNKHHTATGLSYGFVIAFGCYSVNVVNCYAQDLRHFVSIGGSTGINLFVNVTNCHITGCRAAGIDSHAAGDFVNFSGNTIMGSMEGITPDGINCSGLNAIINDNIVVDARRHAILYQQTTNFDTGSGSVTISGNQIINNGDNSGGADTGILVLNSESSVETLAGVVISNNRIEGLDGSGNTGGTYGIYVKAAHTIKDVAINGNVLNINDIGGIRVEAVREIKNVVVSGNVVNQVADSSSEPGIFLKGTPASAENSSVASKVQFGSVSDNVINLTGSSGGSIYGVRLERTNSIIVSTNIIVGNTAGNKIFPATATDSDNTFNLYSNNIGS